MKSFKEEYYLEAIDRFKSALSVDNTHVDSWFFLAKSYQAVFEEVGLYYEPAVNAYHEVIKYLDEKAPDWDSKQYARVLLAQLLIRGGQHREAIENLKYFLELQPDFELAEVVYNNLGVAYYYLDEYEQAASAFQEAVKINKNYASANFNLRSVFVRLSLFDRVMVSRRSGQLEAALKTLNILLELAPRYLMASLHKAMVLHELGRIEEAQAEISRVLTLRPNKKITFELRNLLGDILLKKGLNEDALAEYRKCLRLFPGFIQTVEKIDALEKTISSSAADAGQNDATEVERLEGVVKTPTAQFPM